MYERMRKEFEMREEQRRQQMEQGGGAVPVNGSISPQNIMSSQVPSLNNGNQRKDAISELEELQRLAEAARIEEEQRLAREKARIQQQKAEQKRREAEQERLAEERRIAEVKASIEEERKRLEADRARLEEEKKRAEEALRKKQEERMEAEAKQRQQDEDRARIEQEKKEEERIRLEKMKELAKEQARQESEKRDRSEEEKRLGESRLDQLKKLAREQAQYEAEARSSIPRPQTSSSSRMGQDVPRKSIPNRSKADIIDVQVQSYSSSSDGSDAKTDRQTTLDDETKRDQIRSGQVPGRMGVTQPPDVPKKTAEQLAYEEKRQRLSEQLRLQEEKAAIEEERKRLEEQRRQRLEEEKRQQELAAQRAQAQALEDKLSKADDAYEPSKAVLENTPKLLQEVTGPTIPSDYRGKEAYFTGRNVVVYAGRTETVPIHVSTPGTMIEFTIDRKGYDFGLEIIAFMDQQSKGTVHIKEYAPFTRHSNKQSRYEDTILVGSGSTPCMIQFRFDNRYQTLLEKVIISYRIKVTTPPKDVLLRGRRKRAEKSLRAIEDDVRTHKESAASVRGRIEYLEEEITKIKRGMVKRHKSALSLKEEEDRWTTVLKKIQHKQRHGTNSRRRGGAVGGASADGGNGRPRQPVQLQLQQRPDRGRIPKTKMMKDRDKDEGEK
jgi:hypothetical protein